MIVYCATCIVNNKQYIGVTKYPLKTRMIHHLSCARRGSKYAFHNAIRKHGADSFKWKVLDQCLLENDGYELEKYYIKKHKSQINGYNMTAGGETPMAMPGELNGMYGKTHTPEIRERLRMNALGKTLEERIGKDAAHLAKQRMSRSRKGKKHRNDTIVKMQKNSYWKNNGHLIIGENNPNYGKAWDEAKKNKLRGKNNGMYGVKRFGKQNGMWNKKHTKEARAKMSKEQTGSGNGNYREITPEKLDVLVKTYKETNSIADAARSIGDNYNKAKRELIRLNIVTI